MNEVENRLGDHMEDILSHFIAGCQQYLFISSAHHYDTENVNRLDRLRIKLCQNEIVSVELLNFRKFKNPRKIN